jgi:hypothetical protein
MMLGMSQTIRNGKTVSFEFLRIANNGQGLAYIAKPSDAQTETPFAFAKMGEREIVFENMKPIFLSGSSIAQTSRTLSSPGSKVCRTESSKEWISR